MNFFKNSKLDNKIKFIILFIAIGILSIYFIRNYELYRYKVTSRNFLSNIITENYEKAFENLDYSSNQDLNKIEDFRNTWILKMKKYRSEEAYIKSYNNIKIRHINNLPVGSVDLDISENNSIRTYQASIYFNNKKISKIILNSPPFTEVISLNVN